MNREERNRKIIIAFLVVLLVLVIAAMGVAISFSNKNLSDINLKLDQIYSSDYDLVYVDDNFFIGSYEDNKIDVIIDEYGNEILRNLDNVYYDGIYKLKDGRYLIYNNNDSVLSTYIFDGKQLEKYYEIKDVKYIKPIIYKGVDAEYIIGFASVKDGDLYLYGLGNYGIVVVNDVSIIADSFANDVFYVYNENYLVVKNKEELYGVVNFDGDVIIDYKYKDLINNYGSYFIALNDSGNYGVIDTQSNTIVDFKYKVIDQYENYYLFVNDKNKMALLDYNFENITDFDMKYNSLIDYNLRSNVKSINLYKVNGKVAIVNNYLEGVNGTEYDTHNVYIIDGNEITKTIEEIGFGYDNVVYTYDKHYNLNIYSSDVSLLCTIKLTNASKIVDVSSVTNTVIKLEYENNKNKRIVEYFDLSGKKVKFNKGELLFKDSTYKGFIKEHNDYNILTIYDLNDIKLTSINGKKITKYGNYLIIDNSIYKIVIQ